MLLLLLLLYKFCAGPQAQGLTGLKYQTQLYGRNGSYS